MINAKIAVYDGEPPCKLVFCGVEIEIGLTPLKAIVDCARMDLREASGPTRRMLEFPLFVLQQALDMVTTLSPSLSAEDDEANRKRWE